MRCAFHGGPADGEIIDLPEKVKGSKLGVAMHGPKNVCYLLNSALAHVRCQAVYEPDEILCGEYFYLGTI